MHHINYEMSDCPPTTLATRVSQPQRNEENGLGPTWNMEWLKKKKEEAKQAAAKLQNKRAAFKGEGNVLGDGDAANDVQAKNAAAARGGAASSLKVAAQTHFLTLDLSARADGSGWLVLPVRTDAVVQQERATLSNAGGAVAAARAAGLCSATR